MQVTKQFYILKIFGAMGLSAILSGLSYLFFFQSPFTSKREIALSLLLWAALLPLVYLLISRFLVPSLKEFSQKDLWGLLLLSAFIGLIAVLVTLKLPYINFLLPAHTLQVDLPESTDPNREVTLQWITTNLGDIGFRQFEAEGDWQISNDGFKFSGSQAGSLAWKGRTGDEAILVFPTSPIAGIVKVTWDGSTRELDLTSPVSGVRQVSQNFPVSPLHTLAVGFLLWFATSFIFLCLTLFLVTFKIPISKKYEPGENGKKSPPGFLTHLFFPHNSQHWWGGRDWLILIGFLLIATLFFLGRWNGLKPFVVFSSSDAAYVNAYAASLEHPEAFTNDPLLNDPDNFGYYISLQIPLIQVLDKLLGDYGTAYVILTIPYVFLLLAGFYVFSRMLFRNRLFALMLAWITTLLVYASSGDYWGVYIDPQPRMMFQALFPWLLVLALLGLNTPRLRWLVFTCMGLMIYVHPNSIIGVAFALWLGYLFHKPASISWGRHLIFQLGLGFIFLVATLPFMFKYLGSREISNVSRVDYTTAIAFLKDVTPYNFELRATFATYFWLMLHSGLLPLAYLGSVLVYREVRNDNRIGELKLILVWILGIFLVSVGFNTLERWVESQMRILPVFYGLTRNLRYVVPFMETLVLWPLALYWEKISPTEPRAVSRRAGLVLVGLGVIILFGFTFPRSWGSPPPDYRWKSFSCFSQAKLVCPEQTLLDQVAVIEFIGNQTPHGSRVISIPPVDINGAIRYQALRPVVFDTGDFIRLALGNINGAMKLQVLNKEWSEIYNLPDDQQLPLFLDFAKQNDADFAVIKSPVPVWLERSIIYSNTTYSLIDLRK